MSRIYISPRFFSDCAAVHIRVVQYSYLDHTFDIRDVHSGHRSAAGIELKGPCRARESQFGSRGELGIRHRRRVLSSLFIVKPIGRPSMMKLSIKPLAAAVSLALISVSAHAQLASPVQGTAVPGVNGVFLEAWNATTGATELVNLSYAYTDIGGANVGNLNTASGPAWTSATNPSTGTGTVSQLNFGTIANAGTAGFTNYTVVSGATATQTGIE